MRGRTGKQQLRSFMEALGKLVRCRARVYLTGGSTAVLFGWRDSTVDIDVRFVPELDELFRAVADLKEKLDVNIELASPPDFIPEVPGWEDRSIFVGREVNIDFYHFDPYSQALAKTERGHAQDIDDVTSMFRNGLITTDRLMSLFDEIEPQLYKYPALHPPKFRNAVERMIERLEQMKKEEA